jgi:hypothetical protein
VNAGAAQEARLAVGMTAAHRRQVRVGHATASPHDLVDAGQLDLELDGTNCRSRVEWQLDAQADRRQLDHRRVPEIVMRGDPAQTIDRNARREPAWITESHAEIVRSGAGVGKI